MGEPEGGEAGFPVPTAKPSPEALGRPSCPFPKGTIPALSPGRGPSILPPMPLAIRVIAYAAVAVTLLALALFLFRLPGVGASSRARTVVDEGRGDPRPRRSKARVGAGGVVAPRTCPVCGSSLSPGERVHSRVFTPKGDRIMHVYGCPRCWPANVRNVRVCPVCEKEVPREGYLVARLFERPGGSRHVHVLGCTGCRGPRAT